MGIRRIRVPQLGIYPGIIRINYGDTEDTRDTGEGTETIRHPESLPLFDPVLGDLYLLKGDLSGFTPTLLPSLAASTNLVGAGLLRFRPDRKRFAT